MTAGNGMIGIVGILGAPNDVPPPSTNSRSRWDIDDIVILVLDVLVAGELPVVHILDRVVAVGGSDALELTLIRTVDADLLEDRVTDTDADEAYEKPNTGKLHG